MSLVVFFILWQTSSAGYSQSLLKGVAYTSVNEQKGDVNQASTAFPIGWENLDWFYVSVRIGLFLWIALLNLITISSTWARVIDVMDSEVPDYLVLLVLELHLDSFLGHCLPQEWHFWGHFYCYFLLC